MQEPERTTKNDKSQQVKVYIIIAIIIASISCLIGYLFKKNSDNQEVVKSLTLLIDSGNIYQVKKNLNEISKDTYYSIATDTAKSLLDSYKNHLHKRIKEYLAAVINNDSRGAYANSTLNDKDIKSLGHSEFDRKFKNNELQIQKFLNQNSHIKIDYNNENITENEYVFVVADYEFDNSPEFKKRHIKSYKLTIYIDNNNGTITDKVNSEVLSYFKDEDNELASKHINDFLKDQKLDEAYALYKEISNDKFYYSNLVKMKDNILDSANHISKLYGAELANNCLNFFSVQGDAKGDVYTFKLKVENSSPLFKIQSDICIEFVGSQNQTGKAHPGKMCGKISLRPGDGILLSEEIDANPYRRTEAINRVFDSLFGALLGNTVGKLATVKIDKIGRVTHENLTIETIDF